MMLKSYDHNNKSDGKRGERIFVAATAFVTKIIAYVFKLLIF